jgi:hypothetical protein
MPQFMVDIELRDAQSEEFIELIPAQRAMVNDLLYDGKISSYCVSLDRSKVWILMSAEDEDFVIDTLSCFPLIQFMDCVISELLFYNSAQLHISQISLN